MNETIFKNLQGAFVDRDTLRSAMFALGDPSTLELPLADQVEQAILVMKHWRKFMDRDTRFKTPNPKRAVQYLFTEAAEILDAYIKATSNDLRNRPEPASIQGEYGDTLAMAITALLGELIDDVSLYEPLTFLLPQVSFRDPTSIYDEHMINNIGIYAGECLKRIETEHPYWTGSVVWIIAAIHTVLKDRVWIEYLNTLERWEQRAIKSHALT